MTDQDTAVKAPAGREATPEYDSHYFQNYWGGGGPYERNDHWLRFFGDIADGIVRDMHPVSVLDAGCALGFLVEALKDRGVDAWGIDVSEYAISEVHESVRDRCSVGSIIEPLNRKYDLITCIEVIEHVPPEDAPAAIANLCAATDRILLSTTPADYGEATHLNVQPPEMWSAMMAREGFYRDLDRDFSYISPWTALYRRADNDLPETITAYDRAWARQRQEIQEVRQSLIVAKQRIASLEDEAKPGPDATELDRSKEEILRLRDLLIGMESELGAAQGQLAQLQDHSTRITNLGRRVQAWLPTPFWALLLRLRNLLG